MPKFTLIGEHTDLQQNPDGSKMTYEFHCDYLPEVLEHMELFLRGVGFVPNGTLDFVPEEIWTTPDDNIGHSEFYFDTGRNK